MPRGQAIVVHERLSSEPPDHPKTTTGGTIMGKGDKRTKKGKIYRGSYGKRRPRKLKNKIKMTPPTSLKRGETRAVPT